MLISHDIGEFNAKIFTDVVYGCLEYSVKIWDLFDGWIIIYKFECTSYQIGY